MLRICELPAGKLYCFNAKADLWWQQECSKFNRLDVDIVQFPWASTHTLATFAQRTMDMSITINGESAYIETAAGECEVVWVNLQAS